MQSVDGNLKSKTALFFIFCCAILIFSGTAAANTNTFNIMPVDEGESVAKSTFGLDETPWVYVQLPEAGLNATAAWWVSPDENYYITSYMGADGEIWFSLNDDTAMDPVTNESVTWDGTDGIKEIGEWVVHVTYSYADGDPVSEMATTDFTITPEPLSSILFLTGAATLAGRRYIRTSKK